MKTILVNSSFTLVSNWIMFWQLAKKGLNVNDRSCSLPISRHLFRVSLGSSSNKANFLSKFVTGTIRKGECLLLGFRRTKCFCFKSFLLFIFHRELSPILHDLLWISFVLWDTILLLPQNRNDTFFIFYSTKQNLIVFVWKEKHS